MPQITRLKGTQLELDIKIPESVVSKSPAPARRRARRAPAVLADQIPIPFDLFSQGSTKSKRPRKLAVILEELQELEE